MHPAWHGAQHHLMVRAFRPDAVSVEVVRMDTHDICARLDPRHPEGFFEGRVADLEHPFPYLLRVTYPDGSIDFRPDPYAFPPDPHRLRPPSHQRRIPSAPLRSNGCAPYLTGGNRWRVVRRLGARSSTRQHRRGFQPVGWTSGRTPTTAKHPSPSMRCTSGHGYGIPTATPSTITTSLTTSSTMHSIWDTPISSCSPSPSTLSTSRGDTRFWATTLQRAGMVRPRTFSTSSTTVTSTGSASSWTGSRAFPERRPRSGPFQRHRPLRAQRPETGHPPQLGQPRLQLRPQRGAELPHRQRALLARPLSHRRSPR